MLVCISTSSTRQFLPQYYWIRYYHSMSSWPQFRISSSLCNATARLLSTCSDSYNATPQPQLNRRTPPSSAPPPPSRHGNGIHSAITLLFKFKLGGCVFCKLEFNKRKKYMRIIYSLTTMAWYTFIYQFSSNRILRQQQKLKLERLCNPHKHIMCIVFLQFWSRRAYTAIAISLIQAGRAFSQSSVQPNSQSFLRLVIIDFWGSGSPESFHECCGCNACIVKSVKLCLFRW